MNKKEKLNKIAELEYIWLKNILNPFLYRVTYANLKKLKLLINHNTNKTFNDLDEKIKEIYIEMSKEVIKIK